MTYSLKTGDLEPPLRAILSETDGTPIDLAAADAVTARIRRRGTAGELALEREAVITDAAAGEIELIWEEGETVTPGDYEAEFTIEWPDARPQTVPTRGTARFRIEDNLALEAGASLDAPYDVE